VRAYAAHQGYVEGEDPATSWPRDARSAIDDGFTALKFRIGRYAIAHEVGILERLIRQLPAGTTLLADASGAYTPRTAIVMGRELERLGFSWFEGPLYEWQGYVGYEVLPPALDIAIAGAEVTLSRTQLHEQLARGAFDMIQPDPVICGGIGEAAFYAGVARLHAVSTVPHTDGGAIGIAAALQLLSLLPEPTRSPTTESPLLEVGTGENPWRTDVLANGWQVRDGWVDIPAGPGLGIEVDEAFVRRHARAARRVG
jgi:D-galactarolactone cycloisomerase